MWSAWCCGDCATSSSSSEQLVNSQNGAPGILGIPTKSEGVLSEITDVEKGELKTPREVAAVSTATGCSYQNKETQNQGPNNIKSDVTNDDERRKKEKDKLQRLVKEFASASVDGIDVNIWDSECRAVRKYKFQMERYLRWFSLTLSSGIKEESGAPEVEEYHMQKLTSVSKSQSEIGERFPQLDDPAIKENAVLITSESSHSILFIFDNSIAKDRFYTCMKILRMSVNINLQKNLKK